MSTILITLTEIASSVIRAAEGETLEEVLERIAHVSKDLVRARYAALGIPNETGGLRFFKVAGINPHDVQKLGHLPVGKGLLGAIMHEQQPIRLENIHLDSRSIGFCPGHPEMTTFLGVPIQISGRLYGMLYLSDRLDNQPFDQEDQWLIEIMAGYAALAIAGAELGEQQKRLALLEERERIGMDLHDGIIQSLYAVGMSLDLMRLAGSREDHDIKTAIDNLNTIIEDIRRYILNLKTTHHQTVYGAISKMVERLHIPDHTEVVIDVPEQNPPFNPSVFESICQIANEAISNAFRHSQARKITISSCKNQSMFQITIADDGIGFDLEQTLSREQGLGLQNMIKRASLYRGKVDIQTAAGQGTILTVSIPL